MNLKFTLIKDLKEFDKRYNIIGTAENVSRDVDKSYMQGGTVSDESGSIDFVVWADSGRRYMKAGKKYILKDITIFNYRGALQVHVDKLSKVIREKDYNIESELMELREEKQKVVKIMQELDKKEEDIDREKSKIERVKASTDESLQYLDKKRNQMKMNRLFVFFSYLLFFVIAVSGGLYIYEFAVNNIVPRVNDIIEVSLKNMNIPYRVVEDKNNVITLESMDEHKEKIHFKRPMKLGKPKKNSKDKFKKIAGTKKAKIYSYDMGKNKKPLITQGKKKKRIQKIVQRTDSVVTKKFEKKPVQTKVQEVVPREIIPENSMIDIVYINLEQDEEILMELPGIGPKRVRKLMELRPFKSLDDIMGSRIGIGNYWAEVWKEAIEAGNIVFDQ
jgi:DNA uptake protein ComE-like DNA-binding protein